MAQNVFLRSKTYATSKKDLFMFDAREMLRQTHRDINIVLASPGTQRETADDLERRYNAMMTAWDEWASKAKALQDLAGYLREGAIRG